MPPEPDATTTVATPATEPAADTVISIAPERLHRMVKNYFDLERLRGLPLVYSHAGGLEDLPDPTRFNDVRIGNRSLREDLFDEAEARLRSELLLRVHDAMEESDDGRPFTMAELIDIAEQLRPIATLDGRLDARAAGLLLECVPLSMSTAEREQAAIYLGLLPPTTPAPDGIPAAA